MTKPVDAGSDTVVDADPADVNASACPPEALLSETIRPEPDGERAIVSSSIGVGVAVALAVAVLVALLALLVAVGGTVTAANLSRRLSTRPTAARASAGAGGVLSEPVPDRNARALATAGAMTDAVVGADSLAGVMDWATGVAGALRLVAAGAAFFRDCDAVDACEAACADPDDDELEPPVSA
jgi:hypothetical protein